MYFDIPTDEELIHILCCDRMDGILYKNGVYKVEKVLGTFRFTKNDYYHREDGPALIYKNGMKEWHLDGKRHRTNGPAIIKPDGEDEWWVNNNRHRDDGPAAIYPSGAQIWYVNGKFHRLNGPAITLANGTREWWVSGKPHRLDGPAYEGANGTKIWYVDNNEVPDEWVKENITDQNNVTKEEQILLLLAWGGER